MCANLDLLPIPDMSEWESWTALTTVATENIFASISPLRISEIHDGLDEVNNFSKVGLLTLLSPEIMKLHHIPGQRELTPDEINEIAHGIEIWQEAELHHDSSEPDYLNYLEQHTGIKQDSPDVIQAFKDNNTQKSIAHTLLAYEHLTERESHLVSIWDMPSIIAHAVELYSNDLHPWWDFATTEDYSSKSDHDVTKKTSAPLFRDKDCPTIAHFFAKVIPKILEIREKDPKAALKIFPQSKNVETFNWRISTDSEGNKTWIFEWYPGAYTPRDGEDISHLRVVKNRKISKEERIVRAIIKFDQHGQPIVGLKSQKDDDGKDMPFAFPNRQVDTNSLFAPAEIMDNQDDMISSNNPFIFLKYIVTNKHIRDLITRFEQVHSQIGNADVVVSGMIGPETIFFMDLDIETPKDSKSDASYIKKCLKKKSRNKQPILSNAELLNLVHTAHIFHELELDNITHPQATLAENLFQLFQIAESGYIDDNFLKTVASQLGNHDWTSSYMSNSPSSSYLRSVLSRREYLILQSMLIHERKVEIASSSKPTVNSRRALLDKEIAQSSLSGTYQAQIGMITPSEMDVVKSKRPRHITPTKLSLTPKTVAEL